MDIKNKVIYFNSRFTAKAADQDGEDSVTIEGYASTNDVDRVGDVVPTSVWEKGLTNYLKNPIILAYHNHQMPVGKMVEHRVDEVADLVVEIRDLQRGEVAAAVLVEVALDEAFLSPHFPAREELVVAAGHLEG